MTDTKNGLFGALVVSRRGLFQWVGGGLAGFAVVVLGLFVAIRVIADAEAVERRFNAALDDATDGRYEITLDAVFKFLWYALRSGIYSLVGIDRIPG